MSRPSGLITAVEPGSVGEAAGLRPGDRLLAVNGRPLRDVVDLQFYAAEELLDLHAERDGQDLRIRVRRTYGQSLGLEFATPTFDVDVRRCTNNCDFCFVQMNAPGMRRSLYVKDDDYRHSFLFGSFVTLTNLADEDWARLEEQRLSPLYVSVHSTDPALRRRLLKHRAAPPILDLLRRLAGLGIDVHAQVVLLPGVDDGEHLDRTLADLLQLYGAPVLSVGLVPVGLTRFHRGSCRPYTPQESAALLDQALAWRERARRATGCTFVYPSDEWYLVAGRGVPPAAEYDAFPQLENGVGMVRRLLDEWQALKAALQDGLHDGRRACPRPDRGSPDRAPTSSATLICGTLIAPVLGPMVDEWNALAGAGLRLLPVVNDFFGPVTTVSGLLTGRDVLAALRGRDLGEAVLLPRSMFTGRYGAGDAPPGTTLDGMSLSDLSNQLGVPVHCTGTLAEALEALQP
jgi:putative radical SAM enzyme (TIGR03279 family)